MGRQKSTRGRPYGQLADALYEADAAEQCRLVLAQAEWEKDARLNYGIFAVGRVFKLLTDLSVFVRNSNIG